MNLEPAIPNNMPLRYRPKLHLTEREIKYAMSHSNNNTEAANFLGIHFNTYKQYAKLYFEDVTLESGEVVPKTLYEVHKNQGNRSKRVKLGVKSKYQGLEGLLDILDGKYPQYKGGKRLMERLLEEAIFAPVCSHCGLDEKRITDDAVPLVLDYIDGDKTNHRKNNLRLLCFNDYFYQVGNLLSLKSSYKNKENGS